MELVHVAAQNAYQRWQSLGHEIGMDAVALLNGIVIFMQVLSFGFMTAGAVLALDEAVRSDRRPSAPAPGESVEVRAARVVQ